MSIDIPLLDDTSQPPQIDLSGIPPEEHAAVAHVTALLAALSRFERQFYTAVFLFESSGQRIWQLTSQVESGQLDWGTLDRATDTLSGWRSTAARDGAITLYHFGNTIEAIRHSLPKCPSLNAHIDRSTLNGARKSFRKQFPRYEAIRHVVGHVSDFTATPEKREQHSVKGPYEGKMVKVLDADAIIQFTGNLYQDSFEVTFEGDVHRYEISIASAEKIKVAKEHVYSSFDAATKASPSE